MRNSTKNNIKATLFAIGFSGGLYLMLDRNLEESPYHSQESKQPDSVSRFPPISESDSLDTKLSYKESLGYPIRVNKGETLSDIALEIYGRADAWKRIVDYNIYLGNFQESFNPNKDLKEGMVLFLEYED